MFVRPEREMNFNPDTESEMLEEASCLPEARLRLCRSDTPPGPRRSEVVAILGH